MFMTAVTAETATTILSDGVAYACRRMESSRSETPLTDDLANDPFNTLIEDGRHRVYEKFEKGKCELPVILPRLPRGGGRVSRRHVCARPAALEGDQIMETYSKLF